MGNRRRLLRGVCDAGGVGLVLWLVVLGGSGAAARATTRASGNLIETLTVNAGSLTVTNGTVPLQAGQHYKLVVGGTFTAGASASATGTAYYDALYCYNGTGSFSCSPPFAGEEFFIGVGSSSFGTSSQGTDIDEFQAAGGPQFSQNEVPYQSSHSYTVDFYPPVSGTLKAGGYDAVFGCGAHHVTCMDTMSGTITIQIYELASPPPPSTSCPLPTAPDAYAAAPNEVHVVKTSATCGGGDCQVHRGGTPADAWLPLELDAVVKAGDEITCEPDGSVTVAFADNSTVKVANSTQLKISSFFTEGGVVRTEILLKMGEVAAQVNRSEATKSDFRIKSPSDDSIRDASDASASAVPTGVAVTAGSAVTVFYDPGSRTELVSVQSGKAMVTPKSPRLPLVNLGTGREVAFTPSFESPVAPIGKAGARGGIDILRARDLVLAAVARRNVACRTTTPRSNAFAIRPAPGGWTVSVVLEGRLHGTSVWTVKGARVTPANSLGKRLARGCR